MKKLYVVRPIGQYYNSDVWISPSFDIIWLYKDEYFSKSSWEPNIFGIEKVDVLCYQGFKDLTGIVLAPGEYTTIKVQEG